MFGKYIKYGMLPLTALWLAACSSVNKDVVPDKEPEELYMKAYESLAEENYSQAKDYLEAIDSRYPFGPEGVVELKAAGRKNATDKPSITVNTNIPFTLTVYWGEGQSATVRVEKSGKVNL